MGFERSLVFLDLCVEEEAGKVGCLLRFARGLCGISE